MSASVIRYWLESSVPVIKHENMKELSYFCSVQFKSNHWGIFWSVDLEKRDTSDSMEEEVVCLIKIRSHYIKLFQLCLQMLLLAFRQFSETNLQNVCSAEVVPSNSFVFQEPFSSAVCRLLVLALDYSRRHGHC